MNEDDPMLGSDAVRADYIQRIDDMIQQDIEQRRAQRLSEFQKTRESPAVLQGASGVSGGLAQSVDDG